MEISLTTQRKLEYLTKHFGENWQNAFDGKSVDRAYREAIGDTRKSLYCKIEDKTKARLIELVAAHDTNMSDFVEMLITTEWNKYQQRLKENAETLLRAFG